MTETVARIPRNLEEITPDWLNHHVFPDHRENPVTDLSHDPIGDERGFLSQTLRVETVRPEPSQHLPESFVVKIRPDNEQSREAEASINGFVREVRFYCDIAGDTDTRLTKVYFADADPDSAALVMEDLSHFKGGDQLVGLSHEQVRRVIEAVAPIHAAFWNSPRLNDFTWAPTVDHFNLDSFADAWPEFVDTYGLRIGPQGREIGDYLAKHIDQLEARVASRPRSIVHGDLRADNILFGEGENTGDVIVLDWQLIMRNMAALDLARLYGGSEPIMERASRHRETVALWHDALMRSGVRDYSEADAWADFQLAMLHCTSIPVKVHALFSKTPFKRGAQLRDAMAERFFSCAAEVDALASL
ncbi:MAG: oxidoreductase family protein [Pseudomonadota bacterium]